MRLWGVIRRLCRLHTLIFVQMGERQEAPLVDLSGLGSQLRDLDRKLVKHMEHVVDKIVPVKR